MLLELIERDAYMKLTDFEAFNRCLENTNQLEMEDLSQTPDYEERYLRFLRYIEILEETDQRKVEGKKLIARIYSLEKFKAMQNVSLGVFDNESAIYEEENVFYEEGGTHQVQKALSMHPHPTRSGLRDIDLSEDIYARF